MKKKPTAKASERSDEDVLAPDIELQLSGGEKVVVKELRWQQTRAFVAWVGDRLSRIVSAVADPAGGVATKGAGIFDRLGAEFGLELLERLAIEATGRDSAWLGSLSNTDALSVMSTALNRNLSPELLQVGKDVAAKLGAALNSAPPTTS